MFDDLNIATTISNQLNLYLFGYHMMPASYVYIQLNQIS